ncbi:hypothetical protein [Frigoribacterium sp. PhB24]|uniref:hypothetical protein n=1 Tax=Frigoribacterium sp. PhB24 TaxID=2485204 RepID=UPI000F460929|nr:hypothetical protein [Frigoribacterium sp. PhB24]
MSGLAATALGAFLVVADACWGLVDGPPARDAATIALFSAGLGCLVATLCPVVDRSAAPAPGAPLGDWRRSERIERQFGARPPEIEPADRDEVVAAAGRLIGTSVAVVSRSVWLPAAWLLAWAALVVSGLPSDGQLTFLVLPALLGLIQSATCLGSVVAVGRADAARDRALVLPPAPPPPARSAPPREGRRGSQLDLPGD